MKLIMLFSAIILMVPGMSAGQCDYYCGDANIDGAVNLGDVVYDMEYLYGGGPPPLDNDLECANWDNYRTLTINDLAWIIKGVFSEAWPPYECPPTGAPIAPVVDTSITLYYTDWVYSGPGSGVIALTLHKEFEQNVSSLSFPLRIRIDGEIPVIDSVVIAYGEHFFGSMIYDETGDVVIGIVPFLESRDWTSKQIAFIHVSLPSKESTHTVTMEWKNLTPVQAPTEDSSLIPMFFKTWGDAVEPLLEPHCCVVPGDANMDGTVNVGDAIYIINCVFKDCLGHPCENQLDANCDGSWNVGDAVFLINRIFRGGPEPCCL